jgi:predicted RND superfamily exporter protein
MTAVEFQARALDRQVYQTAAGELRHVELRMTGGAHVKAETTRFLMADLVLVVPLAFGLMALIALLTFRSVRGVGVPLSTIAIGVVWTLGLAAEIDPALNIVTIAVPTLVLVVGFAYTVHVVTAYMQALPDSGRVSPAAARAAVEHVGLATLLTGVTTAAGFLSLTTSNLGAIRQFGLYCAIGVGATMLATLTWAPAVLACLRAPASRAVESRGGASDPLGRMLAWLARFDEENRAAILWVGAAVAVLALVGMSRIEVDTDLITNFPEDARVRRSFGDVNDWLGGASQLTVVLEAAERNAFKEPRNLAAVESLQGRIGTLPQVGSTTSLADYVKLIHRGFRDDADAYAIPESRALVSQLLFFAGSEDLERYVDSTYQETVILVRASTGGTGETNALVARVESMLDELPESIEGRVTGATVLLARTSDDIALGQALSLSAAFLIIYAILVLLFASFRVGFLALLPNALPVLVYFGALGGSGVPLNVTTGLVACLVLGIAVDDTIHFLTRFNVDSRRLADERAGAKAALLHVGRPVTTTSLALCLGFLVLVFSSLRDQQQFGVLAAFTLGFAWLVDLTFTPALAMGVRLVTLWDVLSVDLGRDPQHAIPLLRGLSRSRARIAALMMDIVEHPAGTRLIGAGQKGGDVYVVLEGTLRSSVCRNGAQVPLNFHGRGEAVGEVGLVRGERSADVDCETDVRLLRFEPQDLERLRRRYPRIAAQVLANLNELLAARLVTATGRVA